jgi:hypothetical protein
MLTLKIVVPANLKVVIRTMPYTWPKYAGLEWPMHRQYTQVIGEYTAGLCPTSVLFSISPKYRVWFLTDKAEAR